MKRFVMTVILTVALSSFAFAGEIPSDGSPAPAPHESEQTVTKTSPGDIPSDGLAGRDFRRRGVGVTDGPRSVLGNGGCCAISARGRSQLSVMRRIPVTGRYSPGRPTIQNKNSRLTAAGSGVSLKMFTNKHLSVLAHLVRSLDSAANFPANKIARVVVYRRTEVTSDARSIFGRNSEFNHSRSGPALQRPHSGGHSLVNHHAGFLDWLGRHARLDLSHHRRLHRLLVRQRSSRP